MKIILKKIPNPTRREQLAFLNTCDHEQIKAMATSLSKSRTVDNRPQSTTTIENQQDQAISFKAHLPEKPQTQSVAHRQRMAETVKELEEIKQRNITILENHVSYIEEHERQLKELHQTNWSQQEHLAEKERIYAIQFSSDQNHIAGLKQDLEIAKMQSQHYETELYKAQLMIDNNPDEGLGKTEFNEATFQRFATDIAASTEQHGLIRYYMRYGQQQGAHPTKVLNKVEYIFTQHKRVLGTIPDSYKNPNIKSGIYFENAQQIFGKNCSVKPIPQRLPLSLNIHDFLSTVIDYRTLTFKSNLEEALQVFNEQYVDDVRMAIENFYKTPFISDSNIINAAETFDKDLLLIDQEDLQKLDGLLQSIYKIVCSKEMFEDAGITTPAWRSSGFEGNVKEKSPGSAKRSSLATGHNDSAKKLCTSLDGKDQRRTSLKSSTVNHFGEFAPHFANRNLLGAMSAAAGEPNNKDVLKPGSPTLEFAPAASSDSKRGGTDQLTSAAAAPTLALSDGASATAEREAVTSEEGDRKEAPPQRLQGATASPLALSDKDGERSDESLVTPNKPKPAAAASGLTPPDEAFATTNIINTLNSLGVSQDFLSPDDLDQLNTLLSNGNQEDTLKEITQQLHLAFSLDEGNSKYGTHLAFFGETVNTKEEAKQYMAAYQANTPVNIANTVRIMKENIDQLLLLSEQDATTIADEILDKLKKMQAERSVSASASSEEEDE